MPIYIGDYLGDTQRLTTEQHGAYLLLIFDYWRNGPPPDDDVVLQQITRLDRASWRRHRPVLARMFDVADGVWKHKRIDRELVNARENQDRRSSKAKAAADARWNAKGNAPSMLDAMLGECPPPSPSPPTGDKSPSGVGRKRGSSLPDDFVPVLTEAAQAMADKLGPERLAIELAQFKDHARTNGRVAKDWQAAFRMWLSNAVKWKGNGHGNGSGNGGGRPSGWLQR